MMTILCDALVAFTAYEDWRSFKAAPNNAFLVPGDDPNYFDASLAYATTSGIRYLALAALVVAIMRRRGGGRRAVAECTRLRMGLAGSLVAIDLIYVAAAWTEADPGAGWCLLRISTLFVSAVASIVTVVIFRRPAGGGVGRNADPG